jgi:hypothetical protein
VTVTWVFVSNSWTIQPISNLFSPLESESKCASFNVFQSILWPLLEILVSPGRLHWSMRCGLKPTSAIFSSFHLLLSTQTRFICHEIIFPPNTSMNHTLIILERSYFRFFSPFSRQNFKIDIVTLLVHGKVCLYYQKKDRDLFYRLAKYWVMRHSLRVTIRQ